MFSIQDGNYYAISPSLPYYYKSILVALLTNIYIVLDIINSIQSIIYEIII